MKNYKISVLVVLLLTMTLSCSQSEKKEANGKIIDVAGSVGGGRIIDISEVAKDIRYIPLETSVASLVGAFPTVQYQNGIIYIRDRTDTLKLFDKEGKLVSKFCKKGRGPLEYPFSMDIYPDPNSGDIIVNSDIADNTCILRYDISGKLIGKFNTPEGDDFLTTWPIMLSDNIYIATIVSYLDKPDYSVVVYDSLGAAKLLVPLPKLAPYKSFEEDDSESVSVEIGGKDKKETNIKRYINPDKPYLYQFGGNMRMVYDSNDTIFSISADLHIDKPYIFSYGEYKNNSMDRSSISSGKGKHVSMSGRKKMMETEDFLFMRFDMRDYAHEPYEKTRARGDGTYALSDSYAIFNKKTDKFSFLNQTEKGVLGFRENLMDGPPFWPTYISDDNSLVMMIPAYSLIEYANSHKISEKLAKIVKNLKDTDNPIVVIAK